MSRYDPRHRETRTDSRHFRLNEFFVEGKGINHEVLQKQICRYLGPEAFVKPHTYNGVEGYLVTAVRPLTPHMLDELLELSEAYENLARCDQRGYLGDLSYEEFEACRREEATFAWSGTEYTSSQCGYQARDPYATASPLPGYPPPHGLISDSEQSNDAGFSPYWSAAAVKCQPDLSRESDATLPVSLSSRTNDLATRQPDPRSRDHPRGRYSVDPRVSQSRENAYGSRDSYSSDYTAGYGYPQYTSSSCDAYSSRITEPIHCSACRERSRASNSITLCSICRSKKTPTVDSCDKSSSFYSSAMSAGAGLLVGVVAGSAGAAYTAENAARTAIQSLRR